MEDTAKKVFIIDDDEFLLDMYALKFSENGFKTETAASAQDALEKLQSGFAPDVILLDVVMPGMDGFELIKKIRSEKLAQGAEIVILTNLGQRDEIEKSQAVGVKKYIVKAHHTPSEVVSEIKNLFAVKS